MRLSRRTLLLQALLLILSHGNLRNNDAVGAGSLNGFWVLSVDREHTYLKQGRQLLLPEFLLLRSK